jgi:hypothetical protein
MLFGRKETCCIFSANLLNVSKFKFQRERQGGLIIVAEQSKDMRLEDITAVAANPKSKEDDSVI